MVIDFELSIQQKITANKLFKIQSTKRFHSSAYNRIEHNDSHIFAARMTWSYKQVI